MKRPELLWLACTLTAALAPACASTARLPPKAVELNDAAARALAHGDLAAAEAGLSVAIEYNPRFVEAWVNLGYVELRRGNFEQAEHDFHRARDLNEDIPAPQHALGLLSERRGRRLEAEGFYRDALKVDPGFAPARMNLGRLLFARGQYENAREQFERLVLAAPGDVDAYADEAEVLLQLGRYVDAEAVVDHARGRFGDRAPLMLVAARLALERGQWVEAQDMLAPIAGGADRDRACAAWSWIAVARMSGHDRHGAMEAARSALAMDREDAVARYVVSSLSGGAR